MLTVFFCAITSMVTVLLLLLLFLNQKQTTQTFLKTLTILSLNQNRQMEMNKTLTNLLLSKDPMTFQQLQVATQSGAPQFESLDPVSPLNDEAVANALAERYASQGIDPKLAFAQDEGVDFHEEFGI